MLVDIKTQSFYSWLILTENFQGNIKTQNCLSYFHPNLKNFIWNDEVMQKSTEIGRKIMTLY